MKDTHYRLVMTGYQVAEMQRRSNTCHGRHEVITLVSHSAHMGLLRTLVSWASKEYSFPQSINAEQPQPP